jgi:hypothetical protein
MAVLFGTVSFDVMATDGTLPFVVTDEDGLEWYTATIKVGSQSDYNDLLLLRSKITPVPAMGLLGGGTIVVEKGAGVRDLTIPYRKRAKRTARASSPMSQTRTGTCSSIPNGNVTAPGSS